ncbi:MAG: CHASE domain-containing protein [Pseudomonadota bacterium]
MATIRATDDADKILSQQSSVRTSTWLTWALLFAGLIVTAAAGMYIKKDVKADAQREFEAACDEITLTIDARIHAHAQILRSASALFDASREVTRQEWQAYTLRQQVEQQLPGIQGLGFSLLIPRDQLAQHLQEIRSQGFPDYRVRPEGERDFYTPIIYLEPFSGRNLRAFGYDMLTEPVRRKAMEQARDFDVAALSGKVILVQETDKDVQAGTLMYVPVYRKDMPADTVEHRRAALYGWVYSPYRMNDLMEGIAKGRDLEAGRRIRLQIFDNEQLSSDALLYDSQAKKGEESVNASPLTLQKPITFNDHNWYLRFTRTDEQLNYGRAYVVFSCGIIISLLLCGLLSSMQNTRVTAQGLADRLTVDLRESEEKYRIIFNNEIYAICIFSLETFKLLDVNDACSGLYGYRREEFLSGMTFKDMTAGGEVSAAEIEQIMRAGTIFIPHRNHRKKDGTVFSVEIVTGPYSWKGQKVIFALIHDITEHKQQEEELGKALAETDRMNRLMQGREMRIVEMKQKVNSLCVELGREPIYRGVNEPGFSGSAVQVTGERVARDTTSHVEAAGRIAAPIEAGRFSVRDLGLEKPGVSMSYIPILCSAPLLYAKTHGYFARNGLDVTLTPASGWSGVKNLLAFGHIDAVHLLSPMPLAIRQGLDGRRVDIRLACIQNINGQALTLAKKHAGIKDVRDMKGFTYGVPYFFSMHYYLLCLFLAEHGLDPLKDVTIIEAAPPQMPYYLETGQVDGVFAPEPFNQIAVYRGTGFIHTLSRNIWQGHPCCCFAATEEFISKYPRTYKAMLSSVLEAELALHRASPDERRKIAVELSQIGILNQPDPEPVAQALSGEYDDGTGRQCLDHDRIDFLPTPWAEYGVWMLSQQQRWNQLRCRVDYRAVVERCFDAATRETARAMGFEEQKPSLQGLKNFCGTDPFDSMRAQPFCAFKEQRENEALSLEQRITRLSDLMAVASAGRGLSGIKAGADDAFGVLERLTGEMFKNIRFAQDGLREQNEIVLRSRKNFMSIAEDAEAAMQAAKTAEENLDLALRSSRMGVWVWDIVANRRFFDDQTCALLGINCPSFSGTAEEFFAAMHPDDHEKVKKAMTGLIERDEPYEPEYRAVWPDGSIHYICARGHVVRDDKGQPLRVNGLVWEITALKKAEEEKKMIEAQLSRSEKMASIGQLAAGVAHEINNPTGFIQSNLTTLSRYIQRIAEMLSAYSEGMAALPQDITAAQKLSAELEEKKKSLKISYILGDVNYIISESLEGTERIKSIVNDLKSFSHVDQTEIKPADINQELDTTINVIWSELKYKCTIDKQYGSLPPLECNSGQLKQVFANLLINASHAIEKKGTITIQTSYESGADNGGLIKIVITDTGSGIEPDKINRIFEPFFTTKDVGKGTGLGLSIAYDIIKKHGGDITVESAVGRGTSFTMLLPEISSSEKEPIAGNS